MRVTQSSDGEQVFVCKKTSASTLIIPLLNSYLTKPLKNSQLECNIIFNLLM